VALFLSWGEAAAFAQQQGGPAPAADSGAGNGRREPLWELGIGAGAARIPQYRGSDEYDTYVLPVPYFVYRGDVIKADRGGVRGIFLEGARWATDISLSGNPPVDRDNEARQGMAKLDPVVELGPALRGYLRPRTADWNVYVRPAIRAASAVDLGDPGLSYAGLHGGVTVGWYKRKRGKIGWRYGSNMGIDLADKRYHRYFYRVTGKDAQPDRPAYDPDSGYGGLNVSAFVSRDLTERLSLGVYGRWDHLDGAAFENSPLVRENDNFIAGVGLAWKWRESRRTVPVQDETEL